MLSFAAPVNMTLVHIISIYNARLVLLHAQHDALIMFVNSIRLSCGLFLLLSGCTGMAYFVLALLSIPVGEQVERRKLEPCTEILNNP